MCPTSTRFGRITIIIGLLLLFFGKTQFLQVLAYLFIIAAFIYSAFFTDKSCSINDNKSNKGQDNLDKTTVNNENKALKK